jgi:CheY-like chemotaxis protein
VKVLVVEDEALIRLGIVEMFRDWGFEVHEAGSADEALICIQEQDHFDVLFTDIDMPGTMDGLELIDFVRANGLAIKPMVASAAYALDALRLPPDVAAFSKPLDVDLVRDEFKRVASRL